MGRVRISAPICDICGLLLGDREKSGFAVGSAGIVFPGGARKDKKTPRLAAGRISEAPTGDPLDGVASSISYSVALRT
jgi:hypothetical protein